MLFTVASTGQKKGKVEVAILDEGVGIASSLRHNPHVSASNDLDALRLSILPGISGTSFEGANIDPANEWANSGFGLYVVSELCRQGGSFTIVSGEAGFQVSKEKRSWVSATHEGTAIRLVMNTENLRSIAAALALIVSRGERIAKTILKMDRVEASVASKLARLS